MGFIRKIFMKKSFEIEKGVLLKYIGDTSEVVIPNGVTSIGSSAFENCRNLESITIPDSVTNIGEGAFSNCRSLEDITIPDSVTSIGNAAFKCCSGLTSITIPDSVTSIGYLAFYDCRSLTSITIPDSVTSIGESAFSCCSGLTSIIVEHGNSVYHSAGKCLIETVSKTLISGCKNSVIPDDGSVTSIGDAAFSGCIDLTSITIPDSVTSIGYWAFSDCRRLASVTIPNSVTSIGYRAFDDCSNLKKIIFTGTRSQWDKIGYETEIPVICTGDTLTGFKTSYGGTSTGSMI